MNIPTLKAAILFQFGLLAAWLDAAAAEEKAPAEAATEEKKAGATEYRNWFDVSAQGTFITGDRAQFMQRHQIRNGASGGVEDFHYEQDLPKKGVLQLDGRGIFDNHDYLLKFDADFPDLGYLRGGYREYRTWYDGNGGFFPKNQAWFALNKNELALDRGEAWFEGGLRLPNTPTITFRYSHQFRKGQKDSTSWGDTALTGGFGVRGIVPTFYNIDEDRDIFQADLQHEIRGTEFGVGVRYEMSSNDNRREIHRRPGEPTMDRFVTQRDQLKSDFFNAHAFTETRFNEKILLTTGYSFTSLDTDLSGSRIYGSDYDPVYDPLFAHRQIRDEGFLGLSGGSELRQYAMNLNLMLTPWDHISIVPAIRAEKETIDSVSNFTDTDVNAAGNSFSDLATVFSNRNFLDVTESLEARYTGLTNWVFYTRGEWLEGEGNLRERETLEPALFRDTDDTRLTQKYTAGANWYPIGKLNLGAQYYHKIRANDYHHLADSTPNTGPDRYPAFLIDQDFETDDANFRITWRPLSNLSFVSRYDFQLSRIHTQGDGLAKVESAELTTHILGETITWNPLPRWYLQASGSYALDQTENSAPVFTGGEVVNPRNDYWNANLLTGYALTDKTDLEAQYVYYRADDYIDNSSVGQPYGAGAEEHGVTAGFTHRFSERLRWNMKYGYFNNRDETSGGHNNYQAHVVYSSVRCYF